MVHSTKVTTIIFLHGSCLLTEKVLTYLLLYVYQITLTKCA